MLIKQVKKEVLYLKELNYDDALIEFEFFKKLPSNLNGFINPYHNLSYDEFYSKIQERIDSSNGINLKDGHVPDTYFFLFKEYTIIGLFKIRHYLNDFLKNGSGHIGYTILKEYENKGYGTFGLRLAINELINFKDFKEEEIYLSCDKDNIASLKVMLNNGGYIHHSDGTKHYIRIKINKVE